MAKILKLILTTTAGTTIEFDVEGQLFPRWLPVYKAASQPRQMTNLRLEWTIRGCRAQAVDAATLWGASTPLGKLMAAIKARGTGQIGQVELKNAAGTVIDSITTSTYQNIVLEEIDGSPDPTLPQESWDQSAFLTVRVSGELANADANGIVQFDQRIMEQYDDASLRHLTYITDISTKEGVDVRTKARLFARIPNATLTSEDAWQTNGPDGVDITALDTDSNSSRVPTKASCKSAIQQFGVIIGATSPGGAPGFVRYEVVTTADPTGSTIQTTAHARGPNAMQWVEGNGHRPFFYTSEVVVNAPDKNEYTHVWTSKGTVLRSFRVEVSGGYQSFRFEPLAAALFPIRFDGAFVPCRLEVQIMIRSTFSSRPPTRAQMPFPGILGFPWQFDRSATTETAPYRVEGDTWERRAVAVYWGAVIQDDSDFTVEEQLLSSDFIPSYKFGDGTSGVPSLGGLGNFNG